MRAWVCVLVVVGAVSSVEGQDWDRADRATLRMAPSAFPDLPAAIRADLEQRGCTIPQPFTAKHPANVIKGRFTSADQVDWAVLCSRRRTSSIFVYRGGTTTTVLELASEPDRQSLQVIDGDGRIGYARALTVADVKYLRNRQEGSGGPMLPSLDHDGIKDNFIEKGSVVWYWHGGRWLKLAGAD